MAYRACLKQDSELWNDAFTTHKFGTWFTQLMCHMNIHYECLDAQDDFYAQMKKGCHDTSSLAGR